MRSRTRWVRFALLLMAIELAASAQAQQPVRCPQDYVDAKVLNAIVATKTASDADSVFNRVIAPDGATRMIYAAHRAAISPGARSDALIIQSIPRDAVTFWVLRSLTDPGFVPLFPEVREIANLTFIEVILKAVLRQKRGGREFLMLAYIGRGDAEAGEVFPELHDRFRKKQPNQFWAAYRALPKEARESVCIDCEMLPADQ